jgi:hypothetical protein
MRDPLAVGTRLQHGRTTIRCSAADDDGHAPALDDRVPLDGPAPGKITQDEGQLVEPRVDCAPESAPETPTQLIIKFGDTGPGHQVTTMVPSSGIGR